MPIEADIRFRDKYGFPYGVQQVDNKPRISSEPYLYDIAEGHVPGHRGWSKMGFNSDVQTTEEVIAPQGGTYAFPTAKMQMQAVSSSVEDDPVKADTNAGTGVYSITIYYLDSDYLERTETVTLNGQTAVDTVATDILRIQNVRVASAGTGLTAAGNISVKGKIDGVTYGYIAAGNTRMRQFAWTVPAGKTLYIVQANVYCVHSASNKYATITLRANYDEMLNKRLTNGIFFPHAEALLEVNNIAATYTSPKRFPEKVDVIVVGKSTGTASIAIVMGGWLEDA